MTSLSATDNLLLQATETHSQTLKLLNSLTLVSFFTCGSCWSPWPGLSAVSSAGCLSDSICDYARKHKPFPRGVSQLFCVTSTSMTTLLEIETTQTHYLFMYVYGRGDKIDTVRNSKNSSCTCFPVHAGNFGWTELRWLIVKKKMKIAYENKYLRYG